ncbi:MAG: hypothetical protein AAF629_04055 [Chloroflexota bacterium]
MTLTIKNTELFIFNMHTRMPFKYGIANMTALPHLFVKLTLDVDGTTYTGVAAEGLPPKWFTKNPGTTFVEDIDEMLNVIRSAAEYSLDTEPSETVFDLWREIDAMQSADGMDANYPPLLYGLGTSLVERALIDAFCKSAGVSFHHAVQRNLLGIELGELHDVLDGKTPADYLPEQPRHTLIARHTVGLGDFLTDNEIPDDERVDDGLPQSLTAVVNRYGITHFKIKLFGDPEKDIDRLTTIASIITQTGLTQYGFTLDGNENFKEIPPFKKVWDSLNADEGLKAFMKHLLFVEQPFHRDVALSDETGKALLGWKDRPPIIIDESDGEIESLPTALANGYAGTSHKNCKGVIHGIASACLIEHLRRENPDHPYIMSCEDLANVGPVALLQDLAAVATLGIDHAERNGHHYFAGLSMFPQDLQQAILAAHGDLYQGHPDGYPTLHIKQGIINVTSLTQAPFGLAIDLDPAMFTPIDDWDNSWLVDLG